MSKTCHLTDVSEYDADIECGMKFWWTKCEQKHGIIKKENVLPQRILHQTYDDMRIIAEMAELTPVAIEEAIEPALEKIKDANLQADKRLLELAYRRLGWFAAFALYIEPRIRDEYDDVTIDPWAYMERSDLFVSVDTGRLLRHKRTNDLVYHSYIPAQSLSPKWLERWQREPKVQVEMAALRENLKQDITYAQVRGMGMGFKGMGGRLIHPYTYGKYSAKEKKWASSRGSIGEGYVELPVWEYTGSIVDWVMECGKDVAESQFPLSEPIKVSYGLLSSWLAQRLHREREVAMHKEECQRNDYIRGLHFVKNPKACEPLLGGEKCQFFDLCWADKVGPVDPLKKGFVSTLLNIEPAKVPEVTEVAEVRV